MKLFFLCLLALALQATAQSDISHLDPNCNCVYNWIGPNAFYNFWTLTDLTYATYSEADFWSPDPNIEIVPCQVCYVFINGNNYIFVDNFTYVNEMNIGGNEWDDATVIVGGPGRDNETVYLRIDYDIVPVIFSTYGQRLVNGQTLISIIGKGFGFEASNITVYALDNYQDNLNYESYSHSTYGVNNCPYVIGCDEPGLPSVLEHTPIRYDCNNVRIYHRDSKITCTLDIINPFPEALEIYVTAFGTTASRLILSTYIQ